MSFIKLSFMTTFLKDLMFDLIANNLHYNAYNEMDLQTIKYLQLK